MIPADMWASGKLPEITDKDIALLWWQGRGELLAFANHLGRHDAAITASQILMALALADQAVVERYEQCRGDPDGLALKTVAEKIRAEWTQRESPEGKCST